MQKTLTKRKQAWVDRRKPAAIYGGVITPSSIVEERYYQQLQAQIDIMTAECAKKIERLFSGETAEKYFAMDASITGDAKKLTNALYKQFSESFAGRANRMAELFANQSDKASSTQVHKSLEELSGGLSLSTKNLDGQLKEILKATIAENVDLIKSIPAKYLINVRGAVMRSITQGRGLQDLVPYLHEQRGVTLRRARMIAKDQTRKAMNNLSKGRLQNLGLDDYEWIHTGGSNHPRKEHVEMSGKVFSFSGKNMAVDKDGPCIPGERINCRCRFRPVLKFEN